MDAVSITTDGTLLPGLSDEDIKRLSAYKWRYALESEGFTTEQAKNLLFAQWLFWHGGLDEWGHND
jgi:hypothetical protein